MKSFFSYKILFFLLLTITNLYANEGPLQYPEPAGGWEEGNCQSDQIQSPIDIPSIKDNSHFPYFIKRPTYQLDHANVSMHAHRDPAIIPHHAPCSPKPKVIAKRYEKIIEKINCLKIV